MRCALARPRMVHGDANAEFKSGPRYASPPGGSIPSMLPGRTVDAPEYPREYILKPGPGKSFPDFPPDAGRRGAPGAGWAPSAAPTAAIERDRITGTIMYGTWLPANVNALRPALSATVARSQSVL